MSELHCDLGHANDEVGVKTRAHAPVRAPDTATPTAITIAVLPGASALEARASSTASDPNLAALTSIMSVGIEMTGLGRAGTMIIRTVGMSASVRGGVIMIILVVRVRGMGVRLRLGGGGGRGGGGGIISWVLGEVCVHIHFFKFFLGSDSLWF